MGKYKLNKKIQTRHNIPKTIGSLALAMGLFLITASPLIATEKVEYDDVIINGYVLGFFEQMALEDHLNREIPDGNYWFELETGMWGPIGGTANGRIEVSGEYQEFVKTKFSNQQNQATEIELSASAEVCKNDCMYW